MKRKNITQKIILSTVAVSTLVSSCSDNNNSKFNPNDNINPEVYGPPPTDEHLTLSTDYEGKCGNCQKHLKDADNYCRYCGTKHGEGSFEPYKPEDNQNECVYGAPITFLIECDKCDTGFEQGGMTGDPIPRYCPQCGTEADVTEIDD